MLTTSTDMWKNLLVQTWKLDREIEVDVCIYVCVRGGRTVG